MLKWAFFAQVDVDSLRAEALARFGIVSGVDIAVVAFVIRDPDPVVVSAPEVDIVAAGLVVVVVVAELDPIVAAVVDGDYV